MKSTKATQPGRQEARNETRSETQKLEVRYGQIGISAVAAAMQCRGGGSRPAEAVNEQDEKTKEHAGVFA